MTAENLYKQLIDSEIVGSKGTINFNLQGISIRVRDISVVGNIIQEWLGHYMSQHGIYYRIKNNTQEFPDFLLDKNNSDFSNLLEVKVFTKSPNFDVANFTAYARSLRDHAYRLDSKYLIFKYKISSEDSGIINIENIWLKNVWEICGGSSRSPVKIQWKQNDPVNIRPATWYSNNSKFKPFNNKTSFLKALDTVIGMARLDQSIQKDWLKTVIQNYEDTTGNKIGQ